MKFCLSIVLMLLTVGLINAQSLKVVDTDSKVLGTIGSEISANIKIRNTSNKAIILSIKRVETQISSGQTSYFCIGEACFDERTSILPITKVLAPGAVLEDFKGILKAGLSESQSNIKYCFFDANNPSDSICHEVTYLVEDSELRGVLFFNDAIRISDVYPNPIDNIAIFDYNLIEQNSKAKIIVHNVLGGIVGEYELPGYESKIKIPTQELNPGVYFYTLHVDNKNLITKKMVIKR